MASSLQARGRSLPDGRRRNGEARDEALRSRRSAPTTSGRSELRATRRDRITNCIHAGIAAADAICCAVLGEHAQGDDHQQAIELLRRVTPGGTDLAKALAVLLAMKTAAGYGAAPLTEENAKRVRRSADRLVSAARERVSA
jgi:hypothetical protein